MPGHLGKISGGVIIEVPDPATLTPADWCGYYGIAVARGAAVLYKAVDDDYSTNQARTAGIFYKPGLKVTAPDWQPTAECGDGLHVSPRPFMARNYNKAATRYVAVKCKLADLVVIDNKAKVSALTVVSECDVHGNEVKS